MFETNFDQSGYSNSTSRPQSPTAYRSTVADLHEVLYGGKVAREEICEFVKEVYDPSAIFENPLVLARGQQQIADTFCLLGIVPGRMWSEPGEVCESQYYDGNRLFIMTHTIHLKLLPFLDRNSDATAPTQSSTPSLHPSHSFCSSLPTTPHIDQQPSRDSPISMTHPAHKATSSWPISLLLAALQPRAIVLAFTTVHLKLHTRLVMNEQGRIIEHQDIWGLKETVEGLLPVLGHIYALNRQGIAFFASVASRSLFRKSRQVHEEEEAKRDVQAAAAVAALRAGAFGAVAGGGAGAGTEATPRSSMYHPGSPIRSRKGSTVGFDPLLTTSTCVDDDADTDEG